MNSQNKFLRGENFQSDTDIAKRIALARVSPRKTDNFMHYILKSICFRFCFMDYYYISNNYLRVFKKVTN